MQGHSDVVPHDDDGVVVDDVSLVLVVVLHDGSGGEVLDSV